ncbi:hypothetical protein KM043_005243 [Ampulex compressa]|nr:hypothetical protein KM043_005243 [Ampulex compressa]
MKTTHDRRDTRNKVCARKPSSHVAPNNTSASKTPKGRTPTLEVAMLEGIYTTSQPLGVPQDESRILVVRHDHGSCSKRVTEAKANFSQALEVAEPTTPRSFEIMHND